MVLVAKFVASSQIRLPAQPHLTTRVGPWRAGVVLGPLCEYHRSSQPQASGSSVRIDRRPADVAIERTNCWCRSPLGGGSRANRGGLREMRRPVRSWRPPRHHPGVLARPPASGLLPLRRNCSIYLSWRDDAEAGICCENPRPGEVNCSYFAPTTNRTSALSCAHRKRDLPPPTRHRHAHRSARLTSAIAAASCGGLPLIVPPA
jgi:hypothetical protein